MPKWIFFLPICDYVLQTHVGNKKSSFLTSSRQGYTFEPMGGKKRSKQGSSSSIEEEGTSCPDNLQLLKDSIDCLKKVVSEGFAKLHEDMDKLRHEFKEDLDVVKGTIKDVEKSLSSTQEDVESLKEAVKNTSETSAYNIEAMNKRILDLEKQLKLETERNTNLEQYTRRENLRFNNIKEMEKEDCKAMIYDILQRDLELDTSLIRFHAVHRVGKRMQGRTRPIIVRFVSREDRNLVWEKRSKIKQSTVLSDAYITEDFARAIQEERKVLIKAMIKAREELGMDNVKVVGTYLIIDNQKYDYNTIPDDLK